LYEVFDHQIRPLLLIAVIPAVLSVLLVRAVREDHQPTTAGARPEPIASPAVLPPRLRALIAALTVFSLVNFPDALLLLRAHELGLSTAGVIAAYIVYNLVYAGLAYPAGALSDRFPRHLIFAAGLVFFAIGYLGLGIVSSPGWVFLLLPLYGGFAAATDGVGKAWVASLAPPGRQGGAQGLTKASTAGRSCSPASGRDWPGTPPANCPCCSPAVWPWSSPSSWPQPGTGSPHPAVMRRSQVARAQRRCTGQSSESQSRPARTVTELTAEATTADRRGGAPCTAAVEADNLITNTAGLEYMPCASTPGRSQSTPDWSRLRSG